MLTQPEIWAIMENHLSHDTWTPIEQIYRLVEGHAVLDEQDFQPAGPRSVQIRWQRNVRNVLQRRKTKGDILWNGTAHYMIPSSSVRAEGTRRRGLWDLLLGKGVLEGVAPQLLRDVGVYGGAQGIFVDKARTAHLTSDGQGAAVGLLHIGRRYNDDLKDDMVLYHYPTTKRPVARDENEIQATKNAGLLGLPVFVISRVSGDRRKVQLGYVTDWDDTLQVFLIRLLDDFALATGPREHIDDQPFKPFGNGARQSTKGTRAYRSPEFKFDVLRRYGKHCAVCDVCVDEMLEAAHIIPKESRGSDDARNGLILCANHHKAFDAGMFGFEPSTTRIDLWQTGVTTQDMGITRNDLTHLESLPASEALTWRYNRRNV